MRRIVQATAVSVGMIIRVRKDTIDGRPQLVLDVLEADGGEAAIPLDRDSARRLTLELGHHPLIDEFFRNGEGLQ
jgi:hypothetical protein